MKNYYTLLAFFSLLVSTPRAFSQTPQWHYLGDTIISEGNGGGVTLALDGATPYIAYYAYFNDHSRLIVKQFDGATWVSLDTAGLGLLTYHQISISSNGIPQLAYLDNDNLRFVLKRFEGNAWVTVSESPQVSEQLNAVSIAFDDETLYIAFSHPFFNNQVTVWQYSANGWSVVGQPNISSVWVYPLILKVSNGSPWLAYLESDTSLACIVKKFDGTDWQTIGGQVFTTTFGNFFLQASIDFTVTNSIPYIVYKDWSTQWRLSVLSFDNTEWVSVGQPMFTAPTYSVERIAVDANSQKPYVLFDDAPQDTVGGGLSVMVFDGTSWNYVGQPYFAPQSWEKTLAIHEGIPFVAYQNSDFGFEASLQVFSPITPVFEPPMTEISLDIQPNPILEGCLNIQIQSIHKLAAVAQISDMQGRVFQGSSFQIEPGLMHLQFRLEKLPKGVYIIQLKSDEGRVLCTKQFVVAH